MYARFEAGLTAPSAEVYAYEMPGGQYTNLFQQAKSLGLAARWPDHGRPDDVHRVGRPRARVDDRADPGVEGAAGPLGTDEPGQLVRVGELAVPEQPGDLLERAVLGELLHREAPVEQGVGVGVDLRDRRRVDDDPGQALPDLGIGHRSSSRPGRPPAGSKVYTPSSKAAYPA